MKKQMYLLLALVLILTSPPLYAQKVVIKLGTSADIGSPWLNQLKKASAKWSEISNGTVELRVFPQIPMEREFEVIGRLKNKTLNAAAVSATALFEISPEVSALNLPLIVGNSSEQEHLLEQMATMLDKSLDDKGFVTLSWVGIGSVYMFSNIPRQTVREFQGTTFSYDGIDRIGFHIVKNSLMGRVLDESNMELYLGSKLGRRIEATALTPRVALRMGKSFGYMIEQPIALLTGVIVIDKKAWENIPEKLRPMLRQVFVDLRSSTLEEARKIEENQLIDLKKSGIHVLPMKDAKGWAEVAKHAYDIAHEWGIPRGTIDEILRISNGIRQR